MSRLSESVLVRDLAGAAEADGWRLEQSGTAAGPDLLLLGPQGERIVLEMKVGDPDMVIPSGLGIRLERDIERESAAVGETVPGVLLTNWQVPSVLEADFERRGIHVLQIGPKDLPAGKPATQLLSKIRGVWGRAREDDT